MTSKQIKRIIAKVLIIIIVIIIIERLYNTRDEFHVEAEDASYYGFIEANLTTKEKLEDFEYLYGVLEQNYPFFKVNERLYGVDWLGNKRKYKRLIRNTKNDAEFYIAMDRILKDLNDGHTNIFDGKNFRAFYKMYYPYHSQIPFWDNVFLDPYVKNRYEFDGDLDSIVLYEEPVLETKVLIEDELAYMKIKKMAGDYDILAEDYIKIKEFLKGIEDYEKLIIDIRGNGGGNDTYWMNIVRLLIDEPLNIEYYAFFKDGHRYKYDPYKVQSVAPVKKLDKKTLGKFPEEIATDFDFYKTYSFHLSPWGISYNPEDYIDFKGKIYLLVDRKVFSSAENFASFAKDTGFATLVGETTKGAKDFEWIPITYLPKSKFAIRYSRTLVINSDGTINMETKTTPHIQVDPTPHDDFNKDKCIQAVIKD